jgi:hypothetical protein
MAAQRPSIFACLTRSVRNASLPPPAFREPRHRCLARLSIDAPTGDARALKMRPTTTPSASTSKSSSFQSPDGRFALARLRRSAAKTLCSLSASAFRRGRIVGAGEDGGADPRSMSLSWRFEGAFYHGQQQESEPEATGEKEPGKFHYNPGNMSGKTIDICKDESEQRANKDRIQSRHEQRDQKR